MPLITSSGYVAVAMCGTPSRFSSTVAVNGKSPNAAAALPLSSGPLRPRLTPDLIRIREAAGASLDLIFLQMAGTAPSLKRRKVAEHAREEFSDRICRVQR